MVEGIIKIVIISIISLFVVGMTSIFMYLITDSFFDEFNNSGFNTSDTAKVETSAINTLQFLDWVIVLLLGLTILSCLYAGYRYSDPPLFFVVTFFASMFVGAIGYILDYIFKEVVTTSQFASVITYFPNTIIICTNLHWIGLACIIISGLVAYTSRGTPTEI